MAKTKISEFSTTPGNNTDINGINIAEGCAPSGINNAIRELMSDLKEWQSGAMDVYVIPQGTAAAPGIQLYGDLDTGLYGYAANQLGVAVGGASAGYFSSAGWVGNVNGTITGDINATTIDTTNLEVTNIKAKDGTAAITIADSTGVVSVSTQLAVDNLNLSGNTLSSTDTNGNITIAPNGTGQVVMSGDLDVANIETTNIKAKDGTASITLADSTGVATFFKPTVMSVDSASDALRITQIGAGNALVVEDATNPDATPTVIDQFGNVILGTTARTTPVTSKVEIHSTSSENLGLTPSLGFYNWSATASFASHLTFRHYPSGTVGTLAANTSGDVLGRVVFLSYDGTNAFSASIRGVSGAGGTAPSITYDASGGHNFTSGPIDVENLEVTNIKARDGTAALSIADSTGAVTVATAFAANGGATLGDASGDALTINSSAVSTPNGLNFDSNTFVIDATNNRVGINNASPTVALDVTGALTISGNAILGDATTDTVTVNGYMGVGGIPSADTGIYLTNTALTGTAQVGVLSSITGSSAATTRIVGFNALVASAAASFTVADLVGFRASTLVKGAGSTVTNTHGVLVLDQTQGTNNYGITSLVSSGTNKWNIYASGTAKNLFAGQVVLTNNTTTEGSLYLQSTSPVIGFTDTNSFTDPADVVFVRAGANNLQHQYYDASAAITYDLMSQSLTETVFNENGADIDFRVESDTNTHAIFLDAGNSRVGINNSSPTVALDITGDLKTSGNTTLGDASTDTVQVNGYMGVGGAANSTVGVYAQHAALTGATQVGIYAEPTGTSSATSAVYGVRAGSHTAAASFTVTTAAALSARNAIKGAGSTITNQYGLLIDDQTQGTNNYGIASAVSSGTNKWNIYASGTAANYFQGSVSVGDSTADYKLVVKDAAEANATAFKPVVNLWGTYGTSNRNHGLGFSINSNPPSAGIYVSELGASGANLIFTNSVLYTTATQIERFKLGVTEAVFNDPGNDYDFRVESDTNTHALFVQGSDGFVGIGAVPGFNLEITGAASTGATLRVNGGSGANTNAVLDLTGRGSGNQFNNTEIRSIGQNALGGILTLHTDDSSGAIQERLRITSAGNVSIGGTADRATTVGTKALNIFDGTAPVGTLTNGISIYSSSGEAYVMDAAGNATLFSPHDKETNEWIFKSKHTPTGKVLKIDVEKLLRFVNDHFGLDAIQEFIEE